MMITVLPRIFSRQCVLVKISDHLTIGELLNELLSKVSADWEDIGLTLELEQGQLSVIKSDHHESKKCFREMLKLQWNL